MLGESSIRFSNDIKCRHCMNEEETIEDWLLDHCDGLRSHSEAGEDFDVTTVEEV